MLRIVILLVVLALLGYGGWWLYNTYGSQYGPNKSVAVPSPTPLRERLVKAKIISVRDNGFVTIEEDSGTKTEYVLSPYLAVSKTQGNRPAVITSGPGEIVTGQFALVTLGPVDATQIHVTQISYFPTR